MSIRASLYRAARALGDVSAIRRGRVPQRIVRRMAGRSLWRVTR